MNVRIFRVRAMECMCAKTRPRFILSLKRGWLLLLLFFVVFFWGGGGVDGVRTHVNSKGENPFYREFRGEDRTRDAASCRTASRTTHYSLNYRGPIPITRKLVL